MKCIYCGKSAGFFRRKHKECQQKYNDTIQSLPSKVGILDIAELEQYAYDGFVKPQKLRLIILNAFRLRLKCHMIDHFVTKEEEAEAETFRDRYKIQSSEIISNTEIYSTFSAYCESIKMREVLDGDDYEVQEWRTMCPIVLSKSEKVIWRYSNVKCLEDKTRTRHVGGSQGVSVRIVKGVSFRVGNHKGVAVQEEYTQSIGYGDLYVTTKNIIFCGDKPIKIPLAKVLSIKEYSNGTGVVKDGTNPKQYTFLGITPFIISNTLSLVLE
jgi:hypothetical protein